MAMIRCSLCNAPTSVEEGTTYTAEELEQAAASGFGPPDSAVRAALAAGWSRQQIMARWRQQLAESSMPYWLLCPACAARAAPYLQPAGGGPKPVRRPDRETPRSMPRTPKPPAGVPMPPWLLAEEPTPAPSAPPEPSPRSLPAAPAARPAIRPISARTSSSSAPGLARPSVHAIPEPPPSSPAPAPSEPPPAAPAPPPPPPGLSAERSALIREKAAPHRRSRDPLMTGVIIIVVSLAVGLIFIVSGRFQTSEVPTPFPTLRATNTPVPTRQRATPRPSPTLSTTDKALRQTRAALPDLSGVALTMADMPPGFGAMSPGDLAEWGLSGSDLEQSLAGTVQATVHNPAGFAFTDPPSFEYILTYLVYPLTEAEQADLDRMIAGDPVSLIAALPPVKDRGNATLLPGADRFGDKSGGCSLLGRFDENVPVHLDVLVIRRGAVVAVVQVVYPEGTPPLTVIDAAGILDARLAQALGPTPAPAPTTSSPITTTPTSAPPAGSRGGW